MKSVFALAVLALAGNVRSQLPFHIHTLERPTPTTSQALPYGLEPQSSTWDYRGRLTMFPSSRHYQWDSVARQLSTFLNAFPTNALDIDWLGTQALAAPQKTEAADAAPHVDTPLVPLGHEHAAREARASTKALQWIGPIAPNGEVYAYYGGIQVCANPFQHLILGCY